ncbi:MAG: carbon storage regulator CsrA [Spongiibacteraceae bacterium]
MLVLSRKIGEILKIGDDIEVQILDINRGQVRIGISAPKSTNIVRTELLDRPRNPEMPIPVADTASDQKPPVRILRRRSY